MTLLKSYTMLAHLENGLAIYNKNKKTLHNALDFYPYSDYNIVRIRIICEKRLNNERSTERI